MPIGQPLSFPTLDQIMQLVRSIVRDTFRGVGGQQGRIFTNDAAFTLPFLNSAIRSMNRQLRNEGVTFPIRDGLVIYGLVPQVVQDPALFVSLGFDGYFNGSTTDGAKRLPGDCYQPLVVRQRQTGTNNRFVQMTQAQEGLISGFPQQCFGQWEWRDYSIWMNGSIQENDLMLRYVAGQSPMNTLPADFSTTVIHVQDCEEAIAYYMASAYGLGRDSQAVAACDAKAQAAVDEMALAYVRRAQTVNYRRASYQNAGSDSGQGDGYDGTDGGNW